VRGDQGEVAEKARVAAGQSRRWVHSPPDEEDVAILIEAEPMQERKLLHGFRERRGIDGLRAEEQALHSEALPAAAGKEGSAKEG
jgi:hypothetical protein